MSTPEGKIQSAILKYLKEKKYFCWRQNNGATYDQKMNNGLGGYRSNGVMGGVPDIILIPDDGIFTGIEVKTKTGVQSAAQVLFERRTKRKNGRYYLVRSLDDVKKLGF